MSDESMTTFIEQYDSVKWAGPSGEGSGIVIDLFHEADEYFAVIAEHALVGDPRPLVWMPVSLLSKIIDS